MKGANPAVPDPQQAIDAVPASDVNGFGAFAHPHVPSGDRRFPSLAEAVGPESNPAARVLIATPDIIGPVRNGGIGTAYTELARALARSGHRVTVLYTAGDYSETADDGWTAAYRQIGIQVERLVPPERPRVEGPWPRVRAWRVYEWLKARDGQYDIVHFPDWSGSAYYCLLAKREGLAFRDTLFVVGTHSPTLWAKEGNAEPIHALDDLECDFLERKSVEWADVVVSPSQYMLGWMRQHGWVLPARTYVQPNLLTVAGAPDDRSVRPVWELVFFGRLEPRKGLDVFCGALDRLAQRHPPSRFRVTFLGKKLSVPSFDTDAFLAARAVRWPFLWQVLDTLDQRSALAYLKEPGRLAVIGSAVDNAPYTVLECAAHGIPFIASDRGGIPELVDPRERARVLVDPTPRALAERLDEALQNGWSAAAPAVDLGANEAAWLRFHRSAPRPAARRSVSSGRLPLVSVLVVHRNRPAYLEQALASLAAQDYPRFEVIVVDDGSDEPSALRYLDTFSERWGSRGWRLVRQDNRYLGAARNRAAAEARGEYLLFMDDDNIAKPHELSTLVAVAETTGADILTCGMDLFTGDDPYQAEGRWIPLGPAAACGVFENAFGDANALVRRDVFRQLGGFTELVGVGHEDWEFFAKAVLAGARLEVVPEPLFWYRVHRESMLRTTSTAANYWRSLSPYRAAIRPALEPVLLLAQGQYLERLWAAPPAPAAGDEAELERLREEIETYWTSTSWRITRPFRNVARWLKGLPPETPPVVHNVGEARACLDAIRLSTSWELTGPVRVLVSAARALVRGNRTAKQPEDRPGAASSFPF